MTRRMLLSLACLLFIPCFAFAQAAQPSAAQPAAPELPTSAEAQAMGQAAVKKVEAFADFWIKQMQATEDPDKLIKARTALVTAYSQYDNLSYRQEYAHVVSEKLAVLLSAERNKASQAAIAITRLPQPSIWPTLEKMAASGNSALRYGAAKGYRDIAKTLLLQGGDGAKAMLATLEKLGTQDGEGPVVGSAMVSLVGPADARKQDIDALRPGLEKVWAARIKDMMQGNERIIDAYRQGASAFRAGADDADKKRLLQLLADAMNAATAAFEGNPDNQKGDAATAFRDLLSVLDQKSGELLALDKTPFPAIFSAEKSTDKLATDLRTAYKDVWLPAFAAKGIKPHDLPAGAAMASSAPSSKPASAAASKPTSAPAK